VNTEMQSGIRSAERQDFSRLEDFISYKVNNQLSEPAVVSEKYLKLMENLNNIKDVLSSIKDYD
jgi:hypothetical protein